MRVVEKEQGGQKSFDVWGRPKIEAQRAESVGRVLGEKQLAPPHQQEGLAERWAQAAPCRTDYSPQHLKSNISKNAIFWTAFNTVLTVL